MNTPRKLTLLISAVLLTLALGAGPALGAEETPAEDTAEAPAGEEEDGRIALAETPRDRLGLILLGSLLAAGGIGFLGMRRQLKGEHSQASGEFRWR